ncbi:MAG: site-2 protease family protein [Actinomycetales bacterium]|nr:site-2 protease family protein [Actinomycetales bacterium]
MTTQRWAIARFVVGVVVLAALLDFWAGWALPVVILAILLMVMGHEFGHFITAKRAGLLVSDFFVGFGPVVWSTTVGETRYGVRLLPLGGYVKVPGMTWSDTVDPALESRTYRAASYPRKVLFASAGSLMHLVMALVLAWASLTFVGLPSASHVGIASFTHFDGQRLNPAQLAGLHVGDQVLSIDGVSITDANRLVKLVHDHTGERLRIVVERHGVRRTLYAVPEDGRRLRVGGQRVATGSTPVGYLGIGLQDLIVHQSLLGAIPASVAKVTSIVGLAAKGIVHVFSPGEFSSLFHQVTNPVAATNRTAQLNRPQSIVGVVRIAVQSTSLGVGVLLEILMVMNIFVGLLNMVPMLPLDGGYVLIATYERLRSRRGRAYHADVQRLLPVVYAFSLVLLALFAATLYLDIVHPIANPFQ